MVSGGGGGGSISRRRLRGGCAAAFTSGNSDTPFVVGRVCDGSVHAPSEPRGGPERGSAVPEGTSDREATGRPSRLVDISVVGTGALSVCKFGGGASYRNRGRRDKVGSVQDTWESDVRGHIHMRYGHGRGDRGRTRVTFSAIQNFQRSAREAQRQHARRHLVPSSKSLASHTYHLI